MKLKIELKREGNTISGRVLEQDESLRRAIGDLSFKPIISNTDFSILSGYHPELSESTLFVRGSYRGTDDYIFSESFDSFDDADKVYANIVDLVDELNGEIGGVVDELGNSLYIDSYGETISVISHNGSSELIEDKEDFNHMKIYISGKITDNTNYTEEFSKAEKILKEKFPGATIINPAEVSLPNICDWDDYMVICLRLLDKATHIYMLDNWVHSKGACTEHLHALENDIKVLWSDNSPYRGA